MVLREWVAIAGFFETPVIFGLFFGNQSGFSSVQDLNAPWKTSANCPTSVPGAHLPCYTLAGAFMGCRSIKLVHVTGRLARSRLFCPGDGRADIPIPENQPAAAVRAAVFGLVVTSWFRGDKMFQGSPDRLPDFIQGRGGSRAQEAIIADFHETSRQNVLEVAPDEFVCRQCHPPEAGASGFTIMEGHLAIDYLLYPAVADRDPENIRRQILETGLAGTDRLTVDVPGCLPDLGIDFPQKAELFHLIPKFALEDLRQGSHRQEEIPPGWMPGSGFTIEGAAGDDVMDVGMVFQLPAPSVQDAEEAGVPPAMCFLFRESFFRASDEALERAA